MIRNKSLKSTTESCVDLCQRTYIILYIIMYRKNHYKAMNRNKYYIINRIIDFFLFSFFMSLKF